MSLSLSGGGAMSYEDDAGVFEDQPSGLGPGMAG